MLDISFENRFILKVTFSSTLIFYPVDLVTFSVSMLSIKSATFSKSQRTGKELAVLS
jgi:hypothetical protein